MSEPAARRPRSGDELVLALLAVLTAPVMVFSAAAWAAAQAGALLVHRSAVPVPLATAPLVGMRLLASPGEYVTAWPPHARDALPPAWLFVLLLTAAAVGGGGVLAAGWLRWRAWRARAPHRERRYSPLWARPRDVAALRLDAPTPGRLILGRLGRITLAAEPRRSVCVSAPSQAGKTTRVVIPNVLAASGPLLVASVKPDVAHATLAERARRGDVLVFDPAGLLDVGVSAKWSPLLACTDYPAAERVAAWMVAAAGENFAGEQTRFWEQLAAKMLGPLLFAAAGEGLPMGQVARWVDRRDDVGVLEVLESLGDADALDAFSASVNREPRQRDSVYASVETVVRGFTAASVRTVTTLHRGDATIDPVRLIDEAQTLYLVAPTHEQRRLRPLFVALIESVLRAAYDRHAATGVPLDPPLGVILDEAAHVAPLPDLAAHVATGAGQGVYFLTVWQDLSQVAATYGERDAATIVNNHAARLFLPGSADVATLDTAGRLIGSHRVDRASVTTAEVGARSVTEAPTEAALAPIEYLRQLDADEAVVIYGRLPPIRLRTTAHYPSPPAPPPRRAR